MGIKIGSIKKVVEDLATTNTLPEYTVLCDADSYFYGKNVKQGLSETIDYIKRNNLVAVGLMNIPFGTRSLVQKFQYWEYCSDRVLHVFLSRSGHMRCIPGAGGIYQSTILLEALRHHSLRHAGDDMELTALVQKMGHKVGYYTKGIEVRTSVPRTLPGLIKQRIRWTRGAIETYIKERKFYLKTVFQGNRHSWQILYETLKLVTYAGWYYAVVVHTVFVLLVGLVGTFALCWVLAMLNPEVKGKRLKLTLWMVPTSIMIFIVDTIRLPVAFYQVAYEFIPRLETHESWTDTTKWLFLLK